MSTNEKAVIRFVATADLPFFPGRGGTEAFTISLVRELRRRGIDAGIVTVGLAQKDGRTFWPDVLFEDVDAFGDISSKDITFISGCEPHITPTKLPSYVMVHVPPLSSAYPLQRFVAATKYAQLIANSEYTRSQWAQQLDIDPKDIQILYPFADPAFGEVKRPKKSNNDTRVLFAGRLSTQKGLYLLLEALHHEPLQQGFTFTVTTAGAQTKDGEIIAALLNAHPGIEVVDPRLSPEKMAELLAAHDVLVMPSNHHYWQEAFGMLSIEAQHAGCRVVGSNAAGLPETDCGSLTLFEPGNSYALAEALQQTAQAGPVSDADRKNAAQHFTVAQTADSLLAIIKTGISASGLLY